MTADAIARTYGLRVYTHKRQFADHPEIVARIMVRENQADSPINPRGDGEHPIWDAPKHMAGLALADLQLRVWFYTSTNDKPQACGPYIQYNDAHYIELAHAERMARTLKKIHKAIDKAQAHEPGDVLMTMAKALGLTFTVTETRDGHSSTYRDSQWRFSQLTDARDQLRAQVEKTRAELTAAAA